MKKVRPYIQNGELNKVAAEISPYVRVRLYEESFADRILAVRTVTDQELIPEIENDSFYVISKVEQPTANATVANFGSRPMERYIKGERYKIPLGRHASPIARKNVHELLAYDYDIMEDAQDKDLNRLGVLRDSKLLRILDECTRLSGRRMADQVDLTSEGPFQVDKVVMNRLAATLQTGGRSSVASEDVLKATRFLLNDETRADFALLDQPTLGDRLAEDVFLNGFTSQRVQGIEYIASIKFNLLTEQDSVTLIEFNGAIGASAENVVVAGVTFTVPANTPEAGIAANLAAQINASTADAIAPIVDGEPLVYVRAEVAGDKLRVISAAQWNQDTFRFDSAHADVDVAGLTVAPTVSKGHDLYDIVWCFPDPEFMGEIVRVAGQEVRPEIWRDPAEDTVNRLIREWFGMGMGNENGAAKVRLQRSRFLG